MGGAEEEERIEMGYVVVVLGPRCFGISSRRRDGWCSRGSRDGDEKSEYRVAKDDVIEEEKTKKSGWYGLWREDGVQNPDGLD
ncbi:hypothetical protein DVH24_040102 [Malus domestica]|uniref:Uncharacterized protein n=1 Tax=Malus domestica TaxID=3750 RepID=A0A498I9B5_MALDO|nr:hypothetical protein DVH24_040102 [Malus domestica]